MKFLQIKKLNQHGYDHVFVGAAFVMLVGVVGSAYILINHATSYEQLDVYYYNSGYCLDNYQGGNGRVDLYPCNNRSTQAWAFGTEIKSASGYCLNGSGSVATFSSCNNSSAVSWHWVSTGSANHQLMNNASGKCLDDSRGSDTPNTTIDMYGCKNSKQGPSNQEWFEQNQQTSTTGGSSGGGTSQALLCAKLESYKGSTLNSDECNSVGIAISEVNSYYGNWANSSDLFCLGLLWWQESTWSRFANNGTGAYGIPQANPGNKMGTAANPPQSSAYAQIAWGLNYIKTTYPRGQAGGEAAAPCNAWDYDLSNGLRGY